MKSRDRLELGDHPLQPLEGSLQLHSLDSIWDL